jgi:hypothetical protein
MATVRNNEVISVKRNEVEMFCSGTYARNASLNGKVIPALQLSTTP